MGIIGALRMNPRKTAASGAAKNPVNAGRHNCFGLDVVSCWKRPSAGARRNHEMQSGKKNAAIRGKNEISASSCVAKPMIVRRAMTRISPRMSIDVFM